MVLSPHERELLDILSLELGESRSVIIRQLIKKAAESIDSTKNEPTNERLQTT